MRIRQAPHSGQHLLQPMVVWVSPKLLTGFTKYVSEVLFGGRFHSSSTSCGVENNHMGSHRRAQQTPPEEQCAESEEVDVNISVQLFDLT